MWRVTPLGSKQNILEWSKGIFILFFQPELPAFPPFPFLSAVVLVISQQSLNQQENTWSQCPLIFFASTHTHNKIKRNINTCMYNRTHAVEPNANVASAICMRTHYIAEPYSAHWFTPKPTERVIFPGSGSACQVTLGISLAETKVRFRVAVESSIVWDFRGGQPCEKLPECVCVCAAASRVWFLFSSTFCQRPVNVLSHSLWIVSSCPSQCSSSSSFCLVFFTCRSLCNLTATLSLTFICPPPTPSQHWWLLSHECSSQNSTATI